MTETDDGFEVSRRDLDLRGPGDFFGTKQSGLPEFRLADMVSDFAVLEQARDDAARLDLQDPARVQRLVKSASSILNEKLTGAEEGQIVRFVIAQKIDPNNTFHLIKLWGMFR
ncbi:hypothetical protein BGX30_013029 [Mortierella sp. GBA39]|nr:hypothetical protein BGX30_013029 [Mortierella sp. GBA39]